MPVKRLEGKDEPIIEPDRPVIDAHHHLIDRPVATYMADEYLADVNAGHNVVASVYVETLSFARDEGPEWLRPIGEVEFANGVAAMTAGGLYGKTRVCAGIVGYADLRLGTRAGALLDRCLATAPERFRGIRHLTLEMNDDRPFPTVIGVPPPTGIMTDPGFKTGLGEVAKRGLSFDAAVFHHQLPKLTEFADAFPDLTIVLNHIGLALGFKLDAQGRRQVFEEWRVLLRELAERENVICKIGGLGMPHWGFRFEERSDPLGFEELADAWRPYVETAIDAFGTARCMMESNFPPDGASCGYVPLWNALKHIVQSAGAQEKSDLFHDTAARVYRLTR